MYCCGYCNTVNYSDSPSDQVYSRCVISSVTVKNALVRKNEACSCWVVFFFDTDLLSLPRTFHFLVEAWETAATLRTLKSIVGEGSLFCSVSSTSYSSEAWPGFCVKKPITLPGSLF